MREKEIVFCKGGGCTAKLGAGVLGKILDKLPRQKDENLLIGFEGSDDAAVYKLTDNLAIVQTLDFFPPMVDDPYIFGQIAAANALSDIYAMGGDVKTALNIVCFPESYDMNILGKILQGGAEKVAEAGGVLCGGHSINDDGVKYGLSVTGVIDPNKIRPNDKCQKGDVLILTKPLGVGLVCSAARVNMCDNETMAEAVKSMTFLNKYAAKIADEFDVHACTDVTGFGLLGHLSEMTKGSFTAVIDSKNVPYIKNARKFAEEFLYTAAAQKNRNFVGDKVKFYIDDFAMEEILFDPQTSGGLLFAVSEKDSFNMLEKIKTLGMPCGIIGKIEEKEDFEIKVI